jgi:hypothetical protein
MPLVVGCFEYGFMKNGPAFMGLLDGRSVLIVAGYNTTSQCPFALAIHLGKCLIINKMVEQAKNRTSRLPTSHVPLPQASPILGYNARPLRPVETI